MKLYFQKIILTVCFFAFALFFLSTGYADVIYLKNGRKVTGDIISETETMVSVKTVLGRVVIKQKDIVKIQREEAETNHVRNGDYLMTRGEFSGAVSEYEAALRLDPANPEVATKLADAKQKTAEAVSQGMAPQFAKGDDFASKGFYDSALREYRAVVKQHEGDPSFTTEGDAKIKKLADIMMAKAAELANQQDYNKSFEIYQQSTAILPAELAELAKEKYDGAQGTLFADADRAYDNGQYAAAAVAYNKALFNYPGEPVRQAVNDRIARIEVDLTYHVPVEDVTRYICRAEYVSDPDVVARLGTAPGNFQNMEWTVDNTYHVTEITNNGDIDIDWTINKMGCTVVEASGQKDTIPIVVSDVPSTGYGFGHFTRKTVSGEMTPQGYFVKQVDFTNLISSKGLLGERMDQNSFTGSIFLLSRYPLVQSKKVKVGDTWSEQVNEKRNIGPLELNTIGEIDYTLAGFEIIQGRDCAKLAMNMKITHTLRGTIGGVNGQQQNVDVTLNSPYSGFCYIDHRQKKIVQYSVNGDVEMKGQILGIQSIIPQNIIPEGIGRRFRQGEGRGGGEGGGGQAEGRGGGGGILAPQVQSQQALPDVVVKVALERDLIEESGSTPALPPAAPVTMAPADTTAKPAK